MTGPGISARIRSQTAGPLPKAQLHCTQAKRNGAGDSESRQEWPCPDPININSEVCVNATNTTAQGSLAQGAPPPSRGGGGGGLQPVLMRQPPQLSVKIWGGGSLGGWVRLEGGGVGCTGGVPKGINGRYQLTECPRHRQFQPLV